MSILIRGWNIPKDCIHCFMPCELLIDSVPVGKRREDCPLVEIPMPHGRLIDADKLDEDLIKEKTRMAGLAHISKDFRYMSQAFGLNKARILSKIQDTIIEAEGGVKNE